MRKLALLAAVLVAVLGIATEQAQASPAVRYGLQDDAWLLYGSGTLDDRVGTLDRMGVSIVRFTLDWSQIERTKGSRNWGRADEVLAALRRHGIAAVVTLYGTPRWANGGRSPNWAPTSGGSTFALFASAAAMRYPWVNHWLIWNEPNQRRWLRPTSPRTYVATLLNPAFTAIHRVHPSAKVGGGVTAPPRFDRRRLSRRLDPRHGRCRGAPRRLRAQPVSAQPFRETPWTGACEHCETITMASLERLLREVSRAFGARSASG